VSGIEILALIKNDMIETIQQFINQINEISCKYEEISKISGENFNVFRVIELTSEEVRLHSKFLAELLDPKGSHGQGNIFLDLFIQQLEIKNINSENVKVYVEKHIGNKTDTTGGRIDILVEDDKKNTIIIENKIYADDQYKQLVRYHNYSNNNIFYLNLYGIEPTKESCGELVLDKDFKVISYKKDIIVWLENCKKESASLPLLREGISHYINLIKFLTGQSNNSTMEKEIRDLIALTPQNIKTAIKIANSTEDAKIKLQWIFWQKLREKFEFKGILLLNEKDSKTVTWSKVESFYTKTRNRDKFYGLWTKIYEKNSITIHYGIEIEDNIYIGFTIEKNFKGGISDKPEYEEIRKALKEINNEYVSKNEWWLGWRYVNPKLNFKEFNTETIFNLADRENLDKIATEIVENSINDIESLKQKLQQIKL